MLKALSDIHEANMVHLDIKVCKMPFKTFTENMQPANIFVKGGVHKLGDFGLVSKATTNDEVIEGDCRFMANELLSDRKGRDLRKVTLITSPSRL